MIKNRLKQFKAKLDGDLHLKEILSGSAITFVLKMTGMLLGYVVILIISRKYGAEGVGVYNLTLSILMFAAMIGSMGMNVSILRYVGQFNNKGEEYKLKLLYRYAVEMVVPFSILLGVILYFSAEYIAVNIFDNLVYKQALEFVAFIVPFLALLNISVEFIRGLKKLKVSEYLRSVNQNILNIVLLFIIGLYINENLLAIYTLSFAITISSLVAIIYLIFKLKKIKKSKTKNFTKKELVITSLPMMVTVLFSFFLENIQIYMLEFFSNTNDVGVFSIVVKLATLISLILIVVNTIVAPKISELYWSKRYSELQKVINHTSKLILSSSLILSMIMIFYTNEILNLFGEEFIVGYSALMLLIVGQIINAATGPVSIFLNMTGNQHVLKNKTVKVIPLNDL